MITLYLDTSSSYLYTGIMRDDTLLVETKEDLGQNLSSATLPRIIDNLEKVNLSIRDINTIIVVNGPGSFTGIRIGITIAKVIAFCLPTIKIIPISSLAAMALSAPEGKDYYVPFIDARRGYVFGAIYDKHNTPILEDSYLSLKELEEKVAALNSKEVQGISHQDMEVSFEKEDYQANIAKIVLHYKEQEGISPHLVNPNYIKRTEAEEKRASSI